MESKQQVQDQQMMQQEPLLVDLLQSYEEGNPDAFKHLINQCKNDQNLLDFLTTVLENTKGKKTKPSNNQVEMMIKTLTLLKNKKSFFYEIEQISPFLITLIPDIYERDCRRGCKF